MLVVGPQQVVHVPRGAVGEEVPLVEEEPLLHADGEEHGGRDEADDPEHRVGHPGGAVR